MTDVIVHVGKKGDRGADADNGTGIDGVRLEKIKTPLLNLLPANAISSALNLTRDGEALFTDRYGNELPVASDYIKYVLAGSNDFNSPYWSYYFTYWTKDNENSENPFGQNNATQFTVGDTSGGYLPLETLFQSVSFEAGKVHRFSGWIRLVSGSIESIEVALGSGLQEPAVITETIGSEWVRISTTLSSTVTSGGTFRFMPITTGCTIQVYQFQMTEGVGIYSDVLTDGGVPLLIENNLPIYRYNQDGLLIEGATTNLCLNSQGLNNWTVTGATPTEISGLSADFFNGSIGVISFSQSQSVIASRAGLSLTLGEIYAVSFSVKIITGGIDSATVSLGSDAQTFTIDESLKRKTMMITASGDSITFGFVASESSTQIILTGIQIESGVSTSYAPSAFTPSVRPAESASINVDSLSSFDSPFSLLFSVRNVGDNDLNKYLFNIADELFAYINLNSLYVNNTQIATVNLQKTDLLFVYDGVDIKVYIDGAIAYNVTIAFTPKPSHFYIGNSDGAGANPLNASIKALTWWDFDMTQDEARLLRAN